MGPVVQIALQLAEKKKLLCGRLRCARELDRRQFVPLHGRLQIVHELADLEWVVCTEGGLRSGSQDIIFTLVVFSISQPFLQRVPFADRCNAADRKWQA